MVSGGARSKSGPAADPNALRRNRKDDAGYIDLPAKGRKGRAPAWPLHGRMAAGELEAWRAAWKIPQSFMWEQLQLHTIVAQYIRASIESAEPGASAGLKTVVLRMQDELGLTPSGMNRLRWRIPVHSAEPEKSSDTVATKTGVANAKSRLRLVTNNDAAKSS